MAKTKEEKAAYNRAYYQANKEKFAAYRKAYNEAHKEELADYHKAYHKAYYEAHKEEWAARNKAYQALHREQYLGYAKKYNRTHRARQEEWRKNNIKRVNALTRTRHAANPLRNMINDARRRAKKFGLEFDISAKDLTIPTHCPVLGIPVIVGNGKHTGNSPSLDRIDTEKGYVKGNVAVISKRANLIKNCGTAEEHELIAIWMRQHLSALQCG